MIRWYADNSEARSSAALAIPDIQLFGGIVVTEQAGKELCSILKKVKSGYRRAADFPVKWCFKDLEKEFRENHLDKLYAKLLQESRTWRHEIFSQIAQLDFTIIIAVIESYGSCRGTIKRTKEEVSRFGFCNALQRLGFFIRDLQLGPVEIILDWPDKSNRAPFDLEYKQAFHYGTSAGYKTEYKCGPLKKLGFSDSALFTGMNQCYLLQLSDLIVGATRELVEEALGSRENSFGVSLLKLIKDRFYGAPNNILGRGISVPRSLKDFHDKTQSMVMSLYE